MDGDKKLKNPYITVPPEWELKKTKGPGPFVTKAKYETPKGNIVLWISRQHRKHHFRLDLSYGSTFWAPGAIGWWIGILFAVGSSCFALASIPSYTNFVGVFWDNLTFFIGSIFFTSAGILQYVETVSTPHSFGGNIKDEILFIFFQPRRIDWWSSGVQSIGTLFFNISTFFAIFTITLTQTTVFVWKPDIYGSVCFLIASYLALSEAGHSFFSFNIRSLSWWIAFINFIGSVAFGISAIGSTPVSADQLFNSQMAVVSFMPEKD